MTEPFDEKVQRELDVLIARVQGAGPDRRNGLSTGLRMSRARAAARRAIAGLSKDDARRVVIDLLIEGSSTEELEQLRRAFAPVPHAATERRCDDGGELDPRAATTAQDRCDEDLEHTSC